MSGKVAEMRRGQAAIAWRATGIVTTVIAAIGLLAMFAGLVVTTVSAFTG